MALASVPSYDPSAFTGGLRQGTWRDLRDNPRTPLVNKCIRGQYPPGSTFKMITALAAMEAGISPAYQVFCPGHMSLGRSVFHCWKEHGHGRIAMVQALGQSCDVYFYDLARRVGIDAIAAMAARFGLGQKLGIDLPGEQPGLIPTTDVEEGDAGRELAEGRDPGLRHRPGLRLGDPAAAGDHGGPARQWRAGRHPLAGDAAGRRAPAPIGVPASALDVVLAGMREVVHGARGTARAADPGLPGVEMAGKTGTSQVRRISRAERAAGQPQAQGHPLDRARSRAVRLLRPAGEPALRRGRGGRARA